MKFHSRERFWPSFNNSNSGIPFIQCRHPTHRECYQLRVFNKSLYNLTSIYIDTFRKKSSSKAKSTIYHLLRKRERERERELKKRIFHNKLKQVIRN